MKIVPSQTTFTQNFNQRNQLAVTFASKAFDQRQVSIFWLIENKDNNIDAINHISHRFDFVGIFFYSFFSVFFESHHIHSSLLINIFHSSFFFFCIIFCTRFSSLRRPSDAVFYQFTHGLLLIEAIGNAFFQKCTIISVIFNVAADNCGVCTHLFVCLENCGKFTIGNLFFFSFIVILRQFRFAERCHTNIIRWRCFIHPEIITFFFSFNVRSFLGSQNMKKNIISFHVLSAIDASSLKKVKQNTK